MVDDQKAFINATFYLFKSSHLNDILKDSTTKVSFQDKRISRCHGTLHVDFRQEHGTRGAQKTSNIGRIEPTNAKTMLPGLVGDGLSVCVKQLYSMRGRKTVREEETPETQTVAIELISLRWAQALLVEAYDKMRPTLEENDVPFAIPKPRFVSAAMAICETPTKTKTFLVEEFIFTDDSQPFTKYIHNAVAEPDKDLEEAESEIAQFLCFVQHMQWDLTKGLIYTSDFQGAHRTITSSYICSSLTFK